MVLFAFSHLVALPGTFNELSAVTMEAQFNQNPLHVFVHGNGNDLI